VGCILGLSHCTSRSVQGRTGELKMQILKRYILKLDRLSNLAAKAVGDAQDGKWDVPLASATAPAGVYRGAKDGAGSRRDRSWLGSRLCSSSIKSRMRAVHFSSQHGTLGCPPAPPRAHSRNPCDCSSHT